LPLVLDPRLPRLTANLTALERRIEAARGRGVHAAAKVGSVVTKSAPAAWFPLLAEAGVVAVAESRVQAAQAKRPGAPPGWQWHLIGHLQRNKAARARELFDVFHALDSLALAQALAMVHAGNGAPWPVYIQVNAADDPHKGGIAPAEVSSFVKALADLPALLPVGFMTMARLGADESETRAAFRTLRELRDAACRSGGGVAAPAGLSMGMSDDFEVAVEEGATLVRLGTAVFEGLTWRPPARATRLSRTARMTCAQRSSTARTRQDLAKQPGVT
jgi:pyridoxal phosphate enzyme (YggS family)